MELPDGQKMKYDLSKWFGSRVIWLIMLVAGSAALSRFDSENITSIIWADSEGYYLYLPATFINGGFEGLPCKSGCTIPNEELGWVRSKYTYGVAIMELPAFFAAHLYASFSDHVANGYSAPYGYSILFSALLYFLLGLLFLRRFLKKRFSDWAVNLTLVSIGLGTNLFYYTTGEAGMSHVYSFFLFTTLMYLIDRWITDGRSFVDTFKLAMIASLIVFIRPTGIVILALIPFLDTANVEQIKSRFKSMLDSGLIYWICILIAILFIPQFYYWKQFSGEWFTYSYESEGFTFWKNPKIRHVLLSYQNGLFMYAPILLAIPGGLFAMWKSQRFNAILIAVIFLSATYIFSSWWAWWFGGAFGHRAFIEYFAIGSIPMAFTFEYLRKSASAIKFGTLGLTAIAVYANLRMTYHYAPPWDGPHWNWGRYWDVWEWVFSGAL